MDFKSEKYTWDLDKDASNFEKHGIYFDEASSVFDDNDAIYYYDETHSYDEERFIVIGYSQRANMLMVCHCYRNGDEIIRIISARSATSKERARYWRG